MCTTSINNISRPLRILSIAEGWIPSIKIGIEQPLSYLMRKGYIEFIMKLAIDINIVDIAYCDVVIFSRCASPYILKCIYIAKQLEKQTIYDIDDNFFALPKGTRIGNYYNQPKIASTIERFLKEVDLVKVGSKELLKLVHKYNNNVILHPFCVDLNLLDGLCKNGKKEKIIIGYAGTPGHAPDFEPVIPALNRIINEYGKRIEIQTIGLELKGINKRECIVEHTTFCDDYEAFFKELYKRDWDIGLAPLNDTLSNRSKTNNKFREYGACGIPGIYSNLPIYNESIINMKTGVITEHTEEDWYSAIKLLIENVSLRNEISINAKDFVTNNYSIPKISDLWIKDIFESFEIKPIESYNSLNKFQQLSKKRKKQIYAPQLPIIVKTKKIIKQVLKKVLNCFKT